MRILTRSQLDTHNVTIISLYQVTYLVDILSSPGLILSVPLTCDRYLHYLHVTIVSIKSTWVKLDISTLYCMYSFKCRYGRKILPQQQQSLTSLYDENIPFIEEEINLIRQVFRLPLILQLPGSRPRQLRGNKVIYHWIELFTMILVLQTVTSVEGTEIRLLQKPRIG